MTNVLITGKKPRFNPWLIVQYALRFWPVSVALVGGAIMFATNALAVALSYQGLLWVPMIIGLMMVVVGIIAAIIYIGAVIINWVEDDGWDDLKYWVECKVENYGRPEDK